MEKLRLKYALSIISRIISSEANIFKPVKQVVQKIKKWLRKQVIPNKARGNNPRAINGEN